jgi:putative hemolysin
MKLTVSLFTLAVAPLLTLLLTTLTYALRDLSRVRLAEELGKRGRDDLYEPTLEYAHDLSFLTGAARLMCNTLVLIAMIDICRHMRGNNEPDVVEYLIAAIGATALLCVVSLALPRAIANHIGEEIIARFVGPLHFAQRLFAPVTKIMHAVEHLVERSRPSQTAMQAESLAEEEILDAVSEGEESGVVDDRQRELIESVMDFRNATVDEVMTLRQQITALPVTASVEQVIATIQRSGLSRVPVYDGSIDKIIGVLYARDLLTRLGEVRKRFDLKSMLRKPLFVPRTALLRDILQEMRLTKVHIAIVSDEYGGTAGLLTIEDVLEELVGEISDEHEPTTPEMFKRLDDDRAEVDAAIEIDDFNRLMGVELPEGDDYDTLGGFITKQLQRIPTTGTTLDAEGLRFTVLDASPTKVLRVLAELQPMPFENQRANEQG